MTSARPEEPMPAPDPGEAPEAGSAEPVTPEEGERASPEQDPRLSDRFRQVGDDFGRDVALRLEKNTRKVVREIMSSLHEEILALKQRGFAVPGGADPGAAPREPAMEGRGEPQSRASWDTVREMLRKIQKQFQEASREWNELQRTVEEIQHEMGEDSLDAVFGDILPPRPATAGPEPETGGETVSRGDPTTSPETEGSPAAAASPVAAVSGPGGSPEEGRDAGDGEPGTVAAAGELKLEQKLDDLITLVREHLSERPPGPDEEERSSEWTYRIATEVARRLKDSFPLAAAPAGPLPPEAGEDSAGLMARSRKISIDDVAAMIDEITGQGGQS